MNIKTIVTGLLLILAVGGVIYVVAGGDGLGKDESRTAGACDPVGDCPPGCTGDPTAAAAAADDALPADGVVVYYFHGTKRCYTCNRMEALASLVIDERFAAQVADGSVVFRAVNVENDATRHFIDDFELATKVVVMVERKDGRDLDWRRLDLVWEKVGDEDEYQAYIAENLAACLQHVGRGGA